MFEDADEVQTVSLDEQSSDGLRAWCQDEWTLPKSSPLSRLDRGRVHLSNFLATLSLWVLP